MEDKEGTGNFKLSPVVILSVVLISVLAFLYISKTNSPSYQAEQQIESTKWIPSGFESWDEEIAYKWVEKPDCRTYSVCTAIQVVANVDCPRNIYAELTLMDENYVQYDYTNNLQSSLSTGSIAELTFNWAPDGKFAHFKVSKINCN